LSPHFATPIAVEPRRWRLWPRFRSWIVDRSLVLRFTLKAWRTKVNQNPLKKCSLRGHRFPLLPKARSPSSQNGTQPTKRPYFTFLDAGATVTVASPKGGRPPLDPVSDTPEGQTELTRRFKQDPAAQAMLANNRAAPLPSRPRITTPSSIPVATVRCGTWPRIRVPSASLTISTVRANLSPRSAVRPPGSIVSSSRESGAGRRAPNRRAPRSGPAQLSD
jgi:hypothetical protein